MWYKITNMREFVLVIINLYRLGMRSDAIARIINDMVEHEAE